MAKTPSFNKMSHKELVDAYNAMAKSPAGKALGLPRNRPVNKFSNAAAGIKRCNAMASSIKAATKGEKNPAPKGEAEKAAPKAKANGVDKRKEARPGSNRQKAIDFMMKSKNKQVKRDDLLKAVYGSAKKENNGKLAMVLRGVVDMDIGQRGLPFKLVRKKDGKEVTFGLHKS